MVVCRQSSTLSMTSVTSVDLLHAAFASNFFDTRLTDSASHLPKDSCVTSCGQIPSKTSVKRRFQTALSTIMFEAARSSSRKRHPTTASGHFMNPSQISRRLSVPGTQQTSFNYPSPRSSRCWVCLVLRSSQVQVIMRRIVIVCIARRGRLVSPLS